MSQRVLITGSSGYIASFLIPELTARGYELTGLDRAEQNEPGLKRFVRGDLNDPTAVARALEGNSTILHLAAAKGDWGISDEEYTRDNVDGTRALLEAATAAGIRDWIFYSTVAVLGPGSRARDDFSEPAPDSAYGRSKSECEEILKQACSRVPDLRVVAIRPSAVFGAKHPDSTNIYRLIEGIRKRRFLMVGDGSTVKTTSYIDNLVAAHLFLSDLGLAPGFHPFIYVDSPAWSTGKLADSIATKLGLRWMGPRIPLGIAMTLGRLGDFAASASGVDLPVTSARIRKFCTSTVFDPSKISEAGFEQPVNLETALERTVNWHLDPDSVEKPF